MYKLKKSINIKNTIDNPLDFCKKILQVELSLKQKTVLKKIYNLELSQEDQGLLRGLIAQDSDKVICFTFLSIEEKNQITQYILAFEIYYLLRILEKSDHIILFYSITSEHTKKWIIIMNNFLEKLFFKTDFSCNIEENYLLIRSDWGNLQIAFLNSNDRFYLRNHVAFIYYFDVSNFTIDMLERHIHRYSPLLENQDCLLKKIIMFTDKDDLHERGVSKTQA